MLVIHSFGTIPTILISYKHFQKNIMCHSEKFLISVKSMFQSIYICVTSYLVTWKSMFIDSKLLSVHETSGIFYLNVQHSVSFGLFSFFIFLSFFSFHLFSFFFRILLNIILLDRCIFLYFCYFFYLKNRLFFLSQSTFFFFRKSINSILKVILSICY